MTPEHTRHFSEEEIERYSLDEVPEPELAVWDEHLLVCAACRRRIEESDSYISAMRGAARRMRADAAKARGGKWFTLPRLIPVLAGLALVTLGAILWRGGAPWSARPMVAVALTVTRGPALEAKAPAGARLDLRPDLTGLPGWPAYRLEIVNGFGKPVWKGSFPGAAVTKPLPAGIYFVRIYSPGGDLYREYGLRVVQD